MAVLSLNGDFLLVNQSLCGIAGYPRDVLQNMNLLQMLSEETANDLRKAMQALVSCEMTSFKVETQYRTGGDSTIWVQVSASVVHDGNQLPLYFVAQVEDIGARKLIAEQLMLSAKVFEGSGECIVITDHQKNILLVNRAFTEITGYTTEESVGKVPRLMRNFPVEGPDQAEIWNAILRDGVWSGEICDQRKDGTEYLAKVTISEIKSGDKVTNYLFVFSDITETKKNEAHIEFLAFHDALTGLPNRLMALDRLAVAMRQADRRSTKVAVMSLDLDNFKSINDSIGHDLGDQLIRQVSDRLSEAVGTAATISRQGGDEFLIILPDIVDADDVATVGSRILDVMDANFVLNGHEVSTSISIGVALYPDDSREVQILLRLSDTAMYCSKESGRNTCRFYTDQMNRNMMEHQKIRVGLRRAIGKGDLVLHYQPQYNLVSGHIVGAEALLRWNCPDRGVVQPGNFIPTAEESGLIIPMGEWVLNEACRQAAEWIARDLPRITVAVNVSALQFKRGNIEKSVLHALQKSGLPPHCLELELTESVIIQDVEKVLETVQRLKAIGVLLSIDDFGTGYSSLAYLKRFEVDKLKIDQSFVRDMVNNPNDATIVRTIIQMARSLGLKTVAEGVETEHIMQYLRLLYCDEGQGFHFSRPLPAEEFTRLLSASAKSSRQGIIPALHAPDPEFGP